MVYTPANDTNANPLGAVALFDNESPVVYTARVVAAVSGGQFVCISGTDGTILGSNAASYTANDITVAPALLYDNIGGIALYNVASGTSNYVAVARRGAFLVQATGAVSGGQTVGFNSGGVVNIWDAALGSGTTPGAGQFAPIGRALASADSGGYTLLALNV